MSSKIPDMNISSSSSTQSLVCNTSSDEDFFKSDARSKRRPRRRARLKVNPSRTKIRVKTTQVRRDVDLADDSESEDEVFSRQSAAGGLLII